MCGRCQPWAASGPSKPGNGDCQNEQVGLIQMGRSESEFFNHSWPPWVAALPPKATTKYVTGYLTGYFKS